MNAASLRLKGSTLTTVILELQQYQAAAFKDLLVQKVQQAPALFEAAPLIIDLAVDGLTEAELVAIRAQCNQLGFKTLGFHSVFYEEHTLLGGLPRLSVGNGKTKKMSAVKPEVIVEKVQQQVEVYKPAMVIDRPVRSGQQVYAKDADLVILAQVSEGAEVIADGSIHVYNSLRGKAIAGATGNRAARIYCQKLEAELVSIAGNFKIKDQFDEKLLGKAIQVWLTGDEPRLSEI